MITWSYLRTLPFILVVLTGSVSQAEQPPPISGTPGGSAGEIIRTGHHGARRNRRVRREWRPREIEPGPGRVKGDGEGYYSIQNLMVRDKLMPGLSIGGQWGSFGLDGEIGGIYLQQAAPDCDVDSGWMGMYFGFHLYGRLFWGPASDIKLGTGFDGFGLLAIHQNEWKLGMPLILEARFFVSDSMDVYVQGRYYVLSSDGMEPGVDRQGRETIPIMLVAGIGGWSR